MMPFAWSLCPRKLKGNCREVRQNISQCGKAGGPLPLAAWTPHVSIFGGSEGSQSFTDHVSASRDVKLWCFVSVCPNRSKHQEKELGEIEVVLTLEDRVQRRVKGLLAEFPKSSRCQCRLVQLASKLCTLGHEVVQGTCFVPRSESISQPRLLGSAEECGCV